MTMRTTMTMSKRILILTLFLFASQSLSAQDDSRPALKMEFDKRPSLRFGKDFRLDLRVKVQTDFRTFSPEIVTDEGTFDLHRGRLGIQGEFLKHFEYEVERDFRRNLSTNNQRYPWKDVYLNFKYFDNVQLQVGKFKVPFGLDELTGEHEVDFAIRSRIADDLSPGRDVGGMLHGRFFKRGLSYQAGFFRHDGENGRAHNGSPVARQTYAARVTGTPIRELDVPKILRPLELGIAYTRSNVPEGLSSVRGHTMSDEDLFDYVYVKGPRQRLGAEANWMQGPFSIKGEFINMTEAREEQGIYLDDLPDKISRGWYVTGTWVVTGEKKEGGVEPKKPFIEKGAGAIEVAGRFEQIRFGTTEHIGDAFRSPRSPNIRAQSDRIWTFGVNWYANRYVKVQADGVREKIEDTFRGPLPGTKKFWMGILRLQFVM
jgi:phosphate-selective porin OprO and OprP